MVILLNAVNMNGPLFSFYHIRLGGTEIGGQYCFSRSVGKAVKSVKFGFFTVFLQLVSFHPFKGNGNLESFELGNFVLNSTKQIKGGVPSIQCVSS